MGEKVLAVDLAPERDPAGIGGQMLHAHAEQLRVDGVEPELEQVGIDGEGVAVGMHEDLLARPVRNLDVVAVKRLEDLTPDGRVDQQRVLRPPVVHEIQRVHVGCRPGLQ